MPSMLFVSDDSHRVFVELEIIMLVLLRIAKPVLSCFCVMSSDSVI